MKHFAAHPLCSTLCEHKLLHYKTKVGASFVTKEKRKKTYSRHGHLVVTKRNTWHPDGELGKRSILQRGQNRMHLKIS